MSMLLEITDAEETSEGFFVGRAVVAGVGVQDYSDVFGVKMFCPADEVFAADTMESAKLLPITLRHPNRDVTADNAQALIIGYTGEKVERVGDKMTVNFKITDSAVVKQMKKLIAAGQRIQFSLGYKIKPDKTPGTWMGRVYDWVQRGRKYNHLALLLDQNGRHPDTGLINDSQNNPDGSLLLVMDGELSHLNPFQEAPKVKKTLPNGAEIEVSDADARYLDNHLADHKKLSDDNATLKGEKLQLQRDLNAAQANVMDSAAVDSVVSTRLDLALEAASILDSADIKALAGKSPREIKESVLLDSQYTADELADLQAECKDSYDATLDGIYRTLVRNAGARTSQSVQDSAGRASLAARNQSLNIQDPTAAARQKQAERMENARKGANR